MPAKLALGLCLLFICWLFARSRKQEKGTSAALWVPLTWTLIIGSKPISAWFGLTNATATTDNYLEGSPFDRLVFLLLMAAGLFVIHRRHATWRGIIVNNKWLFLFFLYLGLSTLWSDYPFVSFKRWIKDVGNVIMVLVVLSERDHVSAIRALLLRCGYVLIPLSVVFVKYFPELGRYYDRWTWQPHYGGVTTDKNLLGMTLFVCGLFLCARLFEMRREWKLGEKVGADFGAHFILLLMTFWLLSIAGSSTAITCLLTGVIVFLTMKRPSIRIRVGKMGMSLTFAVVALMLVANALFNLGGVITGMLGRDATLTGRTEIWDRVLSEAVNPFVGAGFYSFWLGDRPERISQGFAFHLNEAHNGFLETYLNSGLIGVLLLLALLGSSMKWIQSELARNSESAALQMSFLVSIVVYNVTESAFNRMDIVWLAFLLFIVEYPRRVGNGSGEKVEWTRQVTPNEEAVAAF